jgi:hypothetical protein
MYNTITMQISVMNNSIAMYVHTCKFLHKYLAPGGIRAHEPIESFVVIDLTEVFKVSLHYLHTFTK